MLDIVIIISEINRLRFCDQYNNSLCLINKQSNLINNQLWINFMAYKTINTFYRTPSVPQIIAYILEILQFSIFYIMIIPSFATETTKIILIVFHSLTGIGTIITVIICSCVDPSDSIMIEHKINGAIKSNLQGNQIFYCEICQAYVQKGSRHCRSCDRCTQKFDHHCMWINNCIGSKNYKIFISMIIFCFFNMLIYVIATAVLANEGLWRQNYFGFMVTVFVLLGIISIFCLLIINLIFFHIFLMCRGCTTYEFMLERRQQQRLEKQKQEEYEKKLKYEQFQKNIAKQRKQVSQKYQSLQSVTKKFKSIQIYPTQQQQQLKNSNYQQFEQHSSKIMLTKNYAQTSEEIFRQEGILSKMSAQVKNYSIPQRQVKNQNQKFETQIFGKKQENNDKQINENYLQQKISQSHSYEARSLGRKKSQKILRENKKIIENDNVLIRKKSLKYLIGNYEAVKPQRKSKSRTQNMNKSEQRSQNNKSLRQNKEHQQRSDIIELKMEKISSYSQKKNQRKFKK